VRILDRGFLTADFGPQIFADLADCADFGPQIFADLADCADFKAECGFLTADFCGFSGIALILDRRFSLI